MERRTIILTTLVDSPEDLTSISKRRETLLPAEVFIPRREDITGLLKPSEEPRKELEDADTSSTLPERRRMVTEVEPKPPK